MAGVVPGAFDVGQGAVERAQKTQVARSGLTAGDDRQDGLFDFGLERVDVQVVGGAPFGGSGFGVDERAFG